MESFEFLVLSCGYIWWGGEGLVRVVGVGELCLDASAFAEASVFAEATTDKTADKRCLILDARNMVSGIKIIGRCGWWW